MERTAEKPKKKKERKKGNHPVARSMVSANHWLSKPIRLCGS